MACRCKGRQKPVKYLWIPEGGSIDGEGTVVYNSKIEAQAKVKRKGGTYIAEGQPIPRTKRGK